MESKLTALRAENWIVFVLGAGIFLSKPIIYASTGVLVVYFLARCIKDVTYRRTAFSEKLIIAGIVIYVFGLLACLLMPTTWGDFGLIARKSLYLVIFAPLLLAFRQPSNRGYALAGLLLGFWVAALLTFAQLEQFNMGRLPGATWMVDVWGVLCGLFLVFVTPRIFDQQSAFSLRVLLAVTAISSFILLSLSGARGPWLGACIALAIYLLIYQRKTLGVLLVLVVISYFPIKQIIPDQISQLTQRAASIADTQTNVSNWTRLTLWKLSFAHSTEKFWTNPSELLLGSGGTSHYNKILDFFGRTDVLTSEEKEKLSAPGFGYPSNDMHNMYLDSTAKYGLIWTFANLFFFLAIAIEAFRRRVPLNQSVLATPALIGCFFVTGMFYDILPHFATTFLIFFVALASQSNNTKKREVQHG